MSELKAPDSLPDPLEDPGNWTFDEGLDEAAVVRPQPTARAGTVSHRRNIATTGEIHLHDGPKVRVAAKTTLIYGTDGSPHHVSLRTSRLEKRSGFIPEWAFLPAQIYLEGAEVEELYAYISEARLAIAEVKDTDYILVRTGETPDIAGLATLIAGIGDNPEAYRPLTDLVGAAQLQALRAVVNLGRFATAKAQLQAMIDANPPEADFQRWFETNDWVFGSEYAGRLAKPRHISPDSQIDLMFLAVDGFADIFELKRPGADVFVVPNGRFRQPSADLNAAFAQAVHYLAEADGMGFFNTVRRGMPVYRPRVRLVIGRSADWDLDAWMAYRDFSTAWQRVEFLTYDMVIRRIELLIGTLTRELKGAADGI